MYIIYIINQGVKNSKEERRQAITRSKTKYMLNKEWCFDVCGNHNNTFAGKYKHLRSKKHHKNVSAEIKYI